MIHPEMTTQDVHNLLRLVRRKSDRPMSTMKNNTAVAQVFHGDHDPHYFGELVKNPTAEHWAEAVRVYCSPGNKEGEPFAVVFKADCTLTLLQLGDFGVQPGSKYLVNNPTAEQWAEAINRYLSPATTNKEFRVAIRVDQNLSLFDDDFDVVEPGEKKSNAGCANPSATRRKNLLRRSHDERPLH